LQICPPKKYYFLTSTERETYTQDTNSHLQWIKNHSLSLIKWIESSKQYDNTQVLLILFQLLISDWFLLNFILHNKQFNVFFIILLIFSLWFLLKSVFKRNAFSRTYQLDSLIKIFHNKLSWIFCVIISLKYTTPV